MEIVNDLNLKKQAESLGISVWKTPSFLFILMGIIIIVAMTATYFISRNYDQPEILIGAESLAVSIIFIIGNFIIRQVEEMAKLNKLKTEFVSVASHQLRTPLSAIRWETELMLSKLNKGLDKRQCKSIATIGLLATRMTRLVNDLLDVTRIDQGRLMLRREMVDVSRVLADLMDELVPLAKEKKIKVIFKDNCKKSTSKCKQFRAFSDKERLRLVIENLFSNAVKYTQAGGKIEIKLVRNHGFVVFSIHDNGVGIPKKQHEQVFTKFFRSDNIVKYQTEGTGLGLYIAKNIVEQSDGRIWFQSREHVGSVFSFSLPIA